MAAGSASGTSTPSTEIHVVDGDTPTLRLQQDGSSGFAPQTWDVAGNETNFFVRDVTNGSTLPLRIRPGAPSSSIFIDVDGKVGLGTSSPDYDLDIDNGTSSSANFVVRGTSGSMILQDQDATSGQQAAQNLVTSGTWKLRGLADNLTTQTVRGITLDLSDGDVGLGCDSSLSSDLTVGTQGSCSSGTRSELNAGDTMFTASSSRTIKENLETIQVADILDRIQKIPVYHYDFIEGPKDRVGPRRGGLPPGLPPGVGQGPERPGSPDGSVARRPGVDPGESATRRQGSGPRSRRGVTPACRGGR